MLGSAAFGAVEVHERTDGHLILGACMRSPRLEHAEYNHNVNRREHTKPMLQVLQLILLCLSGDGSGEYRFTNEWRGGAAGMLCRGKGVGLGYYKWDGRHGHGVKKKMCGVAYIIVGKQKAAKASVYRSLERGAICCRRRCPDFQNEMKSKEMPR